MARRILSLLLFVSASLWAQKSVRYELSFPNAAHHEVHVKATFSGVAGRPLHVFFSRSSPGRYALHEFAKNVYEFQAVDGAGHPLNVSRPDPYSWLVSAGTGDVAVEYTVFGDHADGTYAGIDRSHAHMNMPAVLAWADGFAEAPATLQFHIPPGSNWRPATQLLPAANGEFSAPNLEWMMDSPVELSDHAEPTWKVEDETFRLALHHRGTAEEANAYAQMAQAVVLEEEGVFGSLPHYDGGTYTFLVDYLPWVFGDGMEHRDSTVISSSQDLSTASRYLIGTVAHEFFHSWNVKRIRPRSLEPFDFERVNMSGELWFAEGFTNYYGPLALTRIGLTNLDQLASAYGRAVDAVLNDPGREIHSAVGMSQLAAFVDAAESIDATNFNNTFISYYTYGEALGLGIDLAIRARFPGKSLDDWMRTMWREHPDIDHPYTLADLEKALATATGSSSFAHEIFSRHIEGTEPLDYRALLAQAGLLLRKRNAGHVWLGISKPEWTDAGAKFTTNVLRGSPLYEAGLDEGDTVSTWDGKKIRSSVELEAFLAAHKPGDRVRVEAVTRRGPQNISLTLTEDPSLEIVTYERAGMPLTGDMAQLRKAWLSSKALHPLPKLPVAP